MPGSLHGESKGDVMEYVVTPVAESFGSDVGCPAEMLLTFAVLYK